MAKVRPWERPRSRVRSRMALVVVVALVAAGALGWGLNRRSNVSFDVPAAADPGLPGTWVFTHTVEVPKGGTVFEREVTARSSRSTLNVRESTLGLAGDAIVTCQVEVWQRGVSVARPRESEQVEVGTAPAVYASDTGVHWTGPEGQPANVRCLDESDPGITVAIAEWVRFRSEPATTPIRLGYVPPGYWADMILFHEDEPPLLVLSPPTDSITLPYLTAYYYRGTGQVPGRERAKVNGRPVVLDAYHRLLCFTEGPTTCVTEYSIDPMGNSRTWPGGVRSLLVRTAAGLVVAPDIEDRNTWFEGRAAFPR